MYEAFGPDGVAVAVFRFKWQARRFVRLQDKYRRTFGAETLVHDYAKVGEGWVR